MEPSRHKATFDQDPPRSKVYHSEKSKRHFDCHIKLMLLGDSGVGKSSILARFADGEFFSTLIGTTGIDFRHQIVEIEPGTRAKLEIWDTAGQEKFRNINSKYYRGVMGIILLFDVADRSSFESVSSWLD